MRQNRGIRVFWLVAILGAVVGLLVPVAVLARTSA
jgi:hypothetical protein